MGGSSGSGGSGGGASGSGGATSQGGSSGSGGSSGGGGVTSLSGTRALNALSPAEATQLCGDSYNYFGTAITNATTCKWKGVAFAASSSAPSQQVLQQNCTSQEMACLQVAKPWDTNAGCNDLPATCTATVAEYPACISDEAAAFTQTVNGLPACSALASTDTAKVFDAQAAAPPASCAALSNKCPDLSPPAPLNQ
jgi:hypothetical protein